LGAIGAGTATNWPGSAADPETHVVYAQAGNTGVSSRSLVAPPPGFSDIRYVSGIGGQPFREVFGPGDCCAADAPIRPGAPAAPPSESGAAGSGDRGSGRGGATAAGGRGGAAGGGGFVGLNVQGLPIMKPPYGVLSAIDLEKGELMWQVPHGDTPDEIRNHPALKGLNIPKTGQAGTSGVGLMVTKTLVVMGDP